MTICAHCQAVSCELSVADSLDVSSRNEIWVFWPEVDSQEEIQETREAGCTPKPKPESRMCASTSVMYDSHSDVSEDA